MKKGRALMAILLVLTLFTMVLAGCATKPGKTNDNNKAAGDKTKQPEKMDVVLYFSDDQAMYLVPENREVEVKDKKDLSAVARVIAEELVKGPQNKDLVRTIPPEARVLGVKIQQDTALVDFSEEISTKHWGGSTGETMTISSIVNSITELEGIDKVQILIAGQKAETLAGHWEISQPIERDEEIIKK